MLRCVAGNLTHPDVSKERNVFILNGRLLRNVGMCYNTLRNALEYLNAQDYYYADDAGSRVFHNFVKNPTNYTTAHT